MSEQVDEEPISEQEEVYARAFWDFLAVGDPQPATAGLDPARAAQIRQVLQERWRAQVRRIYRRR